MNIKKLFTDDESAVSPVIGVILMVAITVILAAVIATFVLGLGDSLSNTAPQASFTFDYDDPSGSSNYDELTITHDGGDSIEGQKLSAVISGSSNSDGTYNQLFNTGSTDVTAGSTDTIDSSFASGTSTLDISEATVRVVFEGESGDSTATLARFEGPDA
jgi:flagellin-like protein